MNYYYYYIIIIIEVSLSPSFYLFCIPCLDCDKMLARFRNVISLYRAHAYIFIPELIRLTTLYIYIVKINMYT